MLLPQLVEARERPVAVLLLYCLSVSSLVMPVQHWLFLGYNLLVLETGWQEIGLNQLDSLAGQFELIHLLF